MLQTLFFRASRAPFLTSRVATPSRAPRQAPLEPSHTKNTNLLFLLNLLRVVIRYRDDPCANVIFAGFYRHFPPGRRGDVVVELVGVVKRYGVVIHYVLCRCSVSSTAGSFGYWNSILKGVVSKIPSRGFSGSRGLQRFC